MKISAFVIAFLAAVVPRLAAEPLAPGDVATEDIAFIAGIDGSEQRYVQVLPPEFDAARSVDILVALPDITAGDGNGFSTEWHCRNLVSAQSLY